MKRLRKYSISRVLSEVAGDERRYVDFDGQFVKMNSLRYRMFKKFGVKCVVCGIEGEFFALEAHRNERPHFNLYAVNSQGEEVLMTKDHVIPKSKGGLDVLANLRPMCTICNERKGSGKLSATKEEKNE